MVSTTAWAVVALLALGNGCAREEPSPLRDAVVVVLGATLAIEAAEDVCWRLTFEWTAPTGRSQQEGCGPTRLEMPNRAGHAEALVEKISGAGEVTAVVTIWDGEEAARKTTNADTRAVRVDRAGFGLRGDCPNCTGPFEPPPWRTGATTK